MRLQVASVRHGRNLRLQRGGCGAAFDLSIHRRRIRRDRDRIRPDRRRHQHAIIVTVRGVGTTLSGRYAAVNASLK
jgi:hypothetical protein